MNMVFLLNVAYMIPWFSEIFFWNRWWMFPYPIAQKYHALLFLGELGNRWWMFPYVVVFLALLSKLSTHMSLTLWFLERLWNRWWMFPVHAVVLVIMLPTHTFDEVLDPQLLRWMLRRSIFKGVFALFRGGKKCDACAQVDSGTGPAPQLMDASSL